jgi:DNA-binding NarL/FixJ family response regulator
MGPDGVAGVPTTRVPLVRVLVCDDHEVSRQGLCTLLRSAAGLAVVGEAADGAQALDLATSLRPDVTVVALQLQVPAVRDLVRALSDVQTRVVLLGEAGDGADSVEVLRAGAHGYVHTTVSLKRLVEAVRAVARGETVLDAVVTGELLNRLDRTAAPGEAPEAVRQSPLTARQQAVSELVAEGLTNAEIAVRLQVSRATVKGHVTVALRRLGLRDRTQLAIHVNRHARHDDVAGPSGG